MMIQYKFNEDKLIQEFKEYVDATYAGHYGANNDNLQSMEVISARGRGIDFTSGNIDKYNDRYGKKGDIADWRKDIVKIIHYGFLLLNEHDKKYRKADADFSVELTVYNDDEMLYNNTDTITITGIDDEIK